MQGHAQEAAVYRLVFVLLVVSAALYAQVADANLTGTVLDSSGAAIPNATVQLSSEATGVQLATTTDASGSYRFLNVLTGRYTLAASAAGFTDVTMNGVVLELNRTHTANMRLDPAAISTAVTVTDAPVAIDTSTPALQSAFDSRSLAQLPLTSGSSGVLNVSLLSAGVSSSGGLGYGTGPSIGGQRPTNNNFLIEGVDNNSRASTGPVLIVPNEAVTEVSVQQNQFSPEFGHSSGGQFNTVV
jgi:hypothetical protein